VRYDVAFYAPWAAPFIADKPAGGGAEVQMLRLAQGMAERGLRVCVVVLGTDRTLPASVAGVEVALQPLPRGGPRPVRVLSYLATLRGTIRRLDTRVLVQRSAGSTTGMAAVFARLSGQRFVYSSASTVDFDFKSVHARRVNVWSFHLGVRLANEIVVQNEEQAALCRRRFGREPVVIKSVAEPAQVPTERREAFLWIGRLARYKHPEAFVELARHVPEASFRMVGVASGAEEVRLGREIEAIARQLPNLTLLPPLSREEVGREVASAVAVVNTSDYEGMSNVFLEGWSRGVPALALACDPDGVIAREGVGGFAHGSPDRLADLARAMWSSRSDSTRLSSVCRDYIAREHSPDTVVPHWIDALGLEPH
jgi:glycosyltransferase involved in cell wall biosynthesis